MGKHTITYGNTNTNTHRKTHKYSKEENTYLKMYTNTGKHRHEVNTGIQHSREHLIHTGEQNKILTGTKHKYSFRVI